MHLLQPLRVSSFLKNTLTPLTFLFATGGEVTFHHLTFVYSNLQLGILALNVNIQHLNASGYFYNPISLLQFHNYSYRLPDRFSPKIRTLIHA